MSVGGLTLSPFQSPDSSPFSILLAAAAADADAAAVAAAAAGVCLGVGQAPLQLAACSMESTMLAADGATKQSRERPLMFRV